MEIWRKELYHSEFYNELYLEHHGILGQKWGVRRYQDKNGILTEEGRKRLIKENGKLNLKGKQYLKTNTKKLIKSSNNYKYDINQMRKESNSTLNYKSKKDKRNSDKRYYYYRAAAKVNLDDYKKYEINISKLIGELNDNRYTLSERDKKRIYDKL